MSMGGLTPQDYREPPSRAFSDSSEPLQGGDAVQRR